MLLLVEEYISFTATGGPEVKDADSLDAKKRLGRPTFNQPGTPTLQVLALPLPLVSLRINEELSGTMEEDNEVEGGYV